MSKRRRVFGRKITLHECGDDKRLLLLRVRTKRLDVFMTLRPSQADNVGTVLTEWADAVGTQLVGTEDEDE